MSDSQKRILVAIAIILMVLYVAAPNIAKPVGLITVGALIVFLVPRIIRTGEWHWRGIDKPVRKSDDPVMFWTGAIGFVVLGFSALATGVKAFLQ